MSKRSDWSYAKGFATGQVSILQGLQQQLKDNPEIRTVVAVSEAINNLLEDKTREREELYWTSRKEEDV